MQRSILFNPTKVRRRLYFLINFAYFVLLLGLVVLVAHYLFLWMLPFVLAFIVAAALQKPLKWLVNKTRVSKKFFSVVLVILCVLIIAGVAVIIGWQLVAGATNFVKDEDTVHMLESALLNASSSIQKGLTNLANALSPDALDSVQKGISGSATSFISYITGFFADILNFTTTKLPMLLVSFVIWVVASIFLTIDYHKVTSFLMRQIPERHMDLVNTTRDLCTNTIFKLLRAYLLLMSITFVELSIGLTILHVPYSILIAALIAVVDILPVLGTGTIVIPWALISLIMGNVRMLIGLLILYIFITVIRNILEPRLVSHQIGLNPLVTLFFMFLGLKAIGLFGMLLFPVTIMVLKQLQDDGKIKLWK